MNNQKGKILNIGTKSIQGDAKFSNVLRDLGANITINENSIQVDGTLDSLKPADVYLTDQTDTFMTLAVILSQVEGVSYIKVLSSQFCSI